MMKITSVAAMFGILATPMLAGGGQPYQQGVTLFAYEQNVDNFCPAGTQPIRYNGVICCGTPNATGYGDAPVVRHRPVYTQAPTQSLDPKAPSYAPERISVGKSPQS